MGKQGQAAMSSFNPDNFVDYSLDYTAVKDPYDAFRKEIEAAGLFPQFKDYFDKVMWPDVLGDYLIRAEEQEIDLKTVKKLPAGFFEDTDLICQEHCSIFGERLIYPISSYPTLRGVRAILNRKRSKLVWTPGDTGYIASPYEYETSNKSGFRQMNIYLYFTPTDSNLTEAQLWHELSREVTEETIDVLEVLLAHHLTTELVTDPVSGRLKTLITPQQIAAYLGKNLNDRNGDRVLSRIRTHIKRLSEIKITMIHLEEWFYRNDDAEPKKITERCENIRIAGIDKPSPLLDYRDDLVYKCGKEWNEFYYLPGDVLSYFHKQQTWGHLALLRLDPKYKYAKRLGRYIGAAAFYAGRKGFIPKFKVKNILNYVGINTQNPDHFEVVETACTNFHRLYEIRYLWKIPNLLHIYGRYKEDYQRWVDHTFYVMASPRVAPIIKKEQE